MQAILYLLPFLATFAPISAVPLGALEPRVVSQCAAESTISTGTYTINSNEWGAASGSGSQCSQINGLNGNSLAWQTTWTWADTNPNNVKSYTNVQSSSTYCNAIGAIKSIPTTWSWSYSGQSIRANVAYDTFVGSSCSAGASYEVLVWLGDFGPNIYPLSNSGYPPTPTAYPTIGGVSFQLIVGTNPTGLTAYTFVAQPNTTSYSGDLLNFYKWLGSYQGLPAGDYVQVIQAGTEVFTGTNAELSTYSYTISQS